jgi:MFS family permease
MKMALSRMPRFSRDVVLLFVVSGISALGFYGIHILLKVLYILRLGHGPEYVGLFNGSGALTYMGMGVPSGALGSRFGTKRIMLIGGALTVFGMVLLPLVEFLPGWTRGVWPIATQALLIAGWSMLNVNLVPALSAATTSETANRAYALSGALRSLGTFVGTVSGGLLPGLFSSVLGQSLDLPGPYRLAMWVGAGVSLMGLVPVAMIRERETEERQVRTTARGRFPILALAPLLVYLYLHQVGWATCQSFCTAYLDTDLRLPVSSIGLIVGVGQFLAILAPLLIPRLAARRSNGWTATAATLGIALGLLPLALVPHWAAAGLGQIAIVILWAVWLPALQAYQMEIVDRDWRSLAYGVASMAMGLGFGTTSLAGGYVIAAWGYRSVFLMGAGVAAAGAALMWTALRHASRPEVHNAGPRQPEHTPRD